MNERTPETTDEMLEQIKAVGAKKLGDLSEKEYGRTIMLSSYDASVR